MVEAPGWTGASFTSCLQYSGWSITNTPRECAGLARRFAVSGLDRFDWCLGSGVDSSWSRLAKLSCGTRDKSLCDRRRGLGVGYRKSIMRISRFSLGSFVGRARMRGDHPEIDF
jgi:hypothetical protein